MPGFGSGPPKSGQPFLHKLWADFSVPKINLSMLGIPIHGPMPVSGETFGELSMKFSAIGPYEFLGKQGEGAISPCEFPSETHLDQWLPNLSESSGLHRHRSIECSFLKWYPRGQEAIKDHF